MCPRKNQGADVTKTLIINFHSPYIINAGSTVPMAIITSAADPSIEVLPDKASMVDGFVNFTNCKYPQRVLLQRGAGLRVRSSLYDLTF
jgi:hypothetical protein